MMLRSSSSPILGSLLSSYSECPNHHNHHPSDFHSPKHQLPRKVSLHQTGSLHLFTQSPSSHNFSSSPSINADFASEKHSQSSGFRRVQSEGNLDGLASDSSNRFEDFNHHHSTPNKFSCKPHCSVLESIPSSSRHWTQRYEDDHDGEEEKEEEEEEEEEEFDQVEEQREKGEGEDIGSEKSRVYVKNKGSVYGNEVEMENEYTPSKMHLAMGLGVMNGGFNGGGSQKATVLGSDGSDGANMGEYYKRMMEENPGNPLFLRNYAQFLHQSKIPGKAEEYYSRAILIDPGDGEILSKYAQLTWELHHDQERASNYFQRAVQAAPQDSHVLAAYAGFLWETEDEEADSDMPCTKQAAHHDDTLAAAST